MRMVWEEERSCEVVGESCARAKAENSLYARSSDVKRRRGPFLSAQSTEVVISANPRRHCAGSSDESSFM